MISRKLEYTVDGLPFVGLLAYDETRPDKRPGILVCHDGAGLGEHTRERTLALAQWGHVAFALDLFGAPFESRAQGMAVITGLVQNPPLLRKRAHTALELLKDQPGVEPSRTAAVGFCLGGTVALELARGGAELCCAVSFHGGLKTLAPAEPGAVKCKVLVCTGAEDPHVPREQRAAFEDEMRHAQADWQLILYAHAQHAFTHRGVDPVKSPGSAYHRLTDERSWRAMRALFDETLGVP